MRGELARNATLVVAAMMLGLALGGLTKFGLGHGLSLAVESYSPHRLATP
jgi:hypothetical protein